MRAFHKSGYSKETAERYVDPSNPLNYLSSFVEKVYKYADGHRTNEISGFRYWFFQDGLNPFQIKFDKPLSEGLNPFDQVMIEGLQAVEIRGNVYFKAEGVKPAGGK